MLVPLLAAISLSGAEPQIVMPASEATIDAFMASIPPAKPVEFGLVPYYAKSLEARNPGRESDIQRITASLKLCLESTYQTHLTDTVRSMARQLGDDKLKRLIEFYKSTDADVFDKLAKRNQSSFSPEEKANWQRILKSYPLTDFRIAWEKGFEEMKGPGGYTDTMAKCDVPFDAEVARLGLKTLDQ